MDPGGAGVAVKAPGARLLFVVAPYYRDITEQLLRGARAAAEAGEASADMIEVPGAFEIPPAIAWHGEAYDGYVALGCVIRGETSHYDYVCDTSARALMTLSVERRLPIGYGILTVENLAQAHARAAANGRDKGGEAARACLALVALKRNLARR